MKFKCIKNEIDRGEKLFSKKHDIKKYDIELDKIYFGHIIPNYIKEFGTSAKAWDTVIVYNITGWKDYPLELFVPEE